jgi:hypothetical protein
MDAGTNIEEKNKDNSRTNRRIISIQFKTRSFSGHGVILEGREIQYSGPRKSKGNRSNFKQQAWL